VKILQSSMLVRALLSTETLRVTVMPMFTGPCDDVPVPCEELKKYADVTDCRYFFQCFNQVLYRDMCRSDQGFDIYVEDCVTIAPDFNCEERCVNSTASLSKGTVGSIRTNSVFCM